MFHELILQKLLKISFLSFKDTNLEISAMLIPKIDNLFLKLIKCCLDKIVVGTKTTDCKFDFAARKIALKITSAVSYTHLTLPTNREV